MTQPLEPISRTARWSRREELEDTSLEGLVSASMKAFAKRRELDGKYGRATVTTVLTRRSEDGLYFAVALAGPFNNLEALEAAMRDSLTDSLPNARRMGIEGE